MVYQKIKRFQDALINYNQSLQIENEIGNKAGAELTLYQIGNVYQEIIVSRCPKWLQSEPDN